MSSASPQRPNIVFIMSDDHAAHSMSCYGSRVNRTPNLDRIANEGMLLENCFCTNSICTPSRATILTGTYNHVNGCTTLDTHMDNRMLTFPKLLRDAGYQTAIFGKWHLGEGPETCPTGFDDWAVLPGQGDYHDPTFIFKGRGGGERRQVKGYVTDIITDMSMDWVRRRDPNRPFMLMYHHKAPHRSWEYDDKHADMFEDAPIPEPDNLHDDYSDRARAAEVAAMRVGVNMTPGDLGEEIPEGLSERELRSWGYQRYMKRYLRCVASVDDNVGRFLDFLDKAGLSENTIVCYTSDQGFFLGDHGWYDKRFMYEESLRMPFVIRYPREIRPGTRSKDMILNVDFASTFLDYAGVEIPPEFQGRSFRSMLAGRDAPPDWRQSMYYRYWMDGAHHNVAAHYGVRTHRHKLVYYYSDGCGQTGTRKPPLYAGRNGIKPTPSCELEPEWELFDLVKDPREMRNVYADPAYADVVRELTAELARLQAEVGDTPYRRGVRQRMMLGPLLSIGRDLAPAVLLYAGVWLARRYGAVPGSVLDVAEAVDCSGCLLRVLGALPTGWRPRLR